MRSLPTKKDTRIETISRVADSMTDMAQTIRQKRIVVPVTTEQEETEIRGRNLWGNDNKNDCWYTRVRGKVLTKLRIQQDIVKTRYSFNRRYQGMPLSLNKQPNFFTRLGSISSRDSPLMSPSNLSEN